MAVYKIYQDKISKLTNRLLPKVNVGQSLQTKMEVIDRGNMVLCGHCRENVKPRIYLTWTGFICGLGIFYLIYLFTKIPQCPNCNFPMTRRSMIFAINLPQFIKSARMSALQMINFKNTVISASKRSDLNRKFDSSQPSGSMNTHPTSSFKMMSNKVHTFISVENYGFRKKYPFRR